MSPHRFDLHDPAASTWSWFLVPRPQWPYTLGAIAGPTFGLSLLLFLTAAYLPGDSGATIGLLSILGATLGAVLLGVAWLGVVRGGQGGLGPLAGSFAFPLAVAYAYLERASHDIRTTAALIAGALAAFAWGHVAAPCDALLRGLAAVSALLWSLVFVAVVKQWDTANALHVLCLIALALTSVCLVISFLQLRHAPPRQDLDRMAPVDRVEPEGTYPSEREGK